ncbi:hypothetical protein AVEN_87279-1 [Araneus ventricosus]|uniref:Uncharacterized protein n=1 Tax=Araneus ventricosus TaxID=182803 RepID=A0A4Y2ECW1_ARAVE|nr:hypothetical protein AVEN_87279-1 [Araneus ventricosus]
MMRGYKEACNLKYKRLTAKIVTTSNLNLTLERVEGVFIVLPYGSLESGQSGFQAQVRTSVRIFEMSGLHIYKPYPDRTEAENQPISLATRGSDITFSSCT